MNINTQELTRKAEQLCLEGYELLEQRNMAGWVKLEEAATYGSQGAMSTLILAYPDLLGTEIVRNIDAVFKKLKDFADKQNPAAMVTLGTIYLGVIPDDAYMRMFQSHTIFASDPEQGVNLIRKGIAEEDRGKMNCLVEMHYYNAFSAFQHYSRKLRTEKIADGTYRSFVEEYIKFIEKAVELTEQSAKHSNHHAGLLELFKQQEQNAKAYLEKQNKENIMKNNFEKGKDLWNNRKFEEATPLLVQAIMAGVEGSQEFMGERWNKIQEEHEHLKKEYTDDNKKSDKGSMSDKEFLQRSNERMKIGQQLDEELEAMMELMKSC